MKTIRGLASAVAKLEGKKSQSKIGDIREILGILSDIAYKQGSSGHFDNPSIQDILYDNGEKRAKKKK